LGFIIIYDYGFILKIICFTKNALTNVLILSKDEAKLVFKVLNYQDIYRPEHLPS
jgi:hypothetical protein